MRYSCGALVIAVFVVCAAAPPLRAHHSVAGQFDTSKPMTLKGVVSKIEWINPHVYVYLDVREQDGSTTQWALSTLPTAMMRKAGLTKESLMGKPGEEISVSVVPARDGTKHLAWISKITYADGHYHQLAGQ